MTTATVTAYHSTVRDFVTLLKPGVMSLVVFTGLAGMVVAPAHINLFQQLLTLFCISLGSGAGAAMNMWYDRDIDAIMARTVSRPVPAGRVAPHDALALGLFLSALSVMLMGLSTNWVAAGILAFAIFFYAVVYTIWLKRHTPQKYCDWRSSGCISTDDWLGGSNRRYFSDFCYLVFCHLSVDAAAFLGAGALS